MAINPLSSLSSLASLGGAGTDASSATAGNVFSDVLKNVVGQAVDNQKAAESLSTAAAMGQDVPLQDVVQAISKAELSLQTLITVRDKAIEAYKEIMQMPI